MVLQHINGNVPIPGQNNGLEANLGIGTQNPISKLHVFKNGTDIYNHKVYHVYNIYFIYCILYIRYIICIMILYNIRYLIYII